MVQNKLPKLVFLAYLIPALIGSSAISASKILCFELSNNNSMGSGGYFSSIGHTIDWLAGKVLIKRKAGSYSHSMLQSRLFNVLILAGTIAIAIYLAEINLKIIKNNNIPIIKNPVLLKLRI